MKSIRENIVGAQSSKHSIADEWGLGEQNSEAVRLAPTTYPKAGKAAGKAEKADSRLVAFGVALKRAERALGRSTWYGIALTPCGATGFTVQLIRTKGEVVVSSAHYDVGKENVYDRVRLFGGRVNDPLPLVFLDVDQKSWVLVDAETLQPRGDTRHGGISQDYAAA